MQIDLCQVDGLVLMNYDLRYMRLSKYDQRRLPLKDQ